MQPIEKGERFKKLFLIKEFGDFLSFKRNQYEQMDAPSAYNLLIQALSDDDIISLEENNIRFGFVIAPASQITLNLESDIINLICFEKHFFSHFTKEETVAIILHELGHVFNPGLEGDEKEFKADDYAVNRNYGNYVIGSLSKAMEKKLPGFNQEVNQRRINRLL